MKISKEIMINPNAVRYSHCGQFLAFGFLNELTIIRTQDEILVFNVQCSGKIKSIEWSVDSDHILCVISDLNSVEVFSISSPEWSCSIQEELAGLVKAVWSPTATHIVTVAEFAVRLSVWSLIGRSVGFIESPLMKTTDKLSFSPNGKRLAVAMGKFGDFKICIFSTFSWTIVSEISPSNEIEAPSNPLWSFNGLYISIWEIVDYEKTILEIYSTKTGEKVGNFKILQSNKLGGISSVAWSQNSQFLLIGCRDDCIYILNHITWSVISVFRHEKVIQNEKCEILREIEDSFMVVGERPTKFTYIVPKSRSNKLPGIKNISTSSDGIHIVSQSQLLPAVVWIWNLKTLSLIHIIAFQNPVTDLTWSRSCLSLLISNGSTKITMWCPDKVSSMCLASCGVVRKIKKSLWQPNGGDKTILLFTPVSVLSVSHFEPKVLKKSTDGNKI